MGRPGKHDFDVLRQLVLPDGSVFRGLLPGRPTRDSLFKDPLRDGQSLLKVWNVNRHTGVVAVFHLQGSSWDRKRRRFVIHDSKPTPLSTQVEPTSHLHYRVCWHLVRVLSSPSRSANYAHTC